MAKTHKLFISHAWAYTNSYRTLCAFLDRTADFSYENHFVPYDDPVLSTGSAKALADAVKRHMNPCQIVIIPAGRYNTHSRWLNVEIDIATKRFSPPRPILGILEWETMDVASVIQSNCAKIVDLDPESIVEGILALSR